MERFSRKSDLISEEKKLELRLGPPGEEDWGIDNENITNTTKTNYKSKTANPSSLLSLGYFPNMVNPSSKKGFLVGEHQEDTWVNEYHQNFSTSSSSSFSENNPQLLGNTKLSPWSSSQYQQSLGKESLKDCGSAKVMVELQNTEKKGFSPSANNTAVLNSSQKRTAPAPAPVVGWPPIRSFRKNLASGCASKLPAESEARNEVSTKFGSEKQTEGSRKGLFVKINMDGIPIGRKVDLKAYNSYEKLSSAVDELFRGLLAAQNDTLLSNLRNNQDGEKAITGLLDGSGEYTLVYEDNEGDRMLVGDVPWHMFVSSVKRLRVLKSSELSSLIFGSKQEKDQTDAALPY